MQTNIVCVIKGAAQSLFECKIRVSASRIWYEKAVTLFHIWQQQRQLLCSLLLLRTFDGPRGSSIFNTTIKKPLLEQWVSGVALIAHTLWESAAVRIHVRRRAQLKATTYAQSAVNLIITPRTRRSLTAGEQSATQRTFNTAVAQTLVDWQHALWVLLTLCQEKSYWTITLCFNTFIGFSRYTKLSNIFIFNVLLRFNFNLM